MHAMPLTKMVTADGMQITIRLVQIHMRRPVRATSWNTEMQRSGVCSCGWFAGGIRRENGTAAHPAFVIDELSLGALRLGALRALLWSLGPDVNKPVDRHRDDRDE
ncbi:MAG: hypothetical protein ACJAYX_004352 [Planctomycetota bacterium]|jgi:hypothetical protein